VYCRSGKDSELLVSIKRPPRKLFEKQLELVFDKMPQRAERTPEILTQVVPQFAFWSSIANLHPARTPWTIELAQVMLQFSMLVCQQIKHLLACPRPIEYSPLVQPIILTPTYSTLPSGHATEAYMFAKVMAAVLAPLEKFVAYDGITKQLNLIACRIADNRVVAGLHFPVDGSAGYVLADALAAYVSGLAQKSLVFPRYFDGGEYFNKVEAPSELVTDPASVYSAKTIAYVGDKGYSVPYAPMVAYMFKRARYEVAYGEQQ
jgi:hypothetical protein